MRKEVRLILAAAVCFDLGVVVVSAHAVVFHDFHFTKIDSLPVTFNFAKIEVDYIAAANACVKAKGKLFEFKGQKFCGTEKTGPTTSPQQK